MYLYFSSSLYNSEQLISPQWLWTQILKTYWYTAWTSLVNRCGELVWLIDVECTNYLIQSDKETHIHIAEPGISPISPCQSQIVIFTWILLHSKDEQGKKICLKGRVNIKCTSLSFSAFVASIIWHICHCIWRNQKWTKVDVSYCTTFDVDQYSIACHSEITNVLYNVLL